MFPLLAPPGICIVAIKLHNQHTDNGPPAPKSVENQSGMSLSLRSNPESISKSLLSVTNGQKYPSAVGGGLYNAI